MLIALDNIVGRDIDGNLMQIKLSGISSERARVDGLPPSAP
ncbi:MAG: hypothetical protein ABW213_13320 [Tardiphaga sp.]